MSTTTLHSTSIDNISTADLDQLRHNCRAGNIEDIRQVKLDMLRNTINMRDPITGLTALHSAALFNRLR